MNKSFMYWISRFFGKSKQEHAVVLQKHNEASQTNNVSASGTVLIQDTVRHFVTLKVLDEEMTQEVDYKIYTKIIVGQAVRVIKTKSLCYNQTYTDIEI